MQTLFKNIALVTGVVGALGLPSLAVAGTGLLTTADEAQLATWLGRSTVQLSALFSKADSDTSLQFHAAVDGKGPTITVMEATNAAGQTWLVGGYNPQSWNSSGTANLTPLESDRKAFIFNLTALKKYTQIPIYDIPDDFGAVQTLNDVAHGPSFGAGFDLDVGSNLKSGSSSLISYCGDNCNTAWVNLLDGSANTAVSYGRIEVYSISAVPEPELWQLLAGGMLGLGLMRRVAARRRSR